MPTVHPEDDRSPRPSTGDAPPWALTMDHPPSANSENETLAPPLPVDIPQSGSVPIAAVPGYEILGELGRGGMGVVYQARQIALDRVVALKMILHADHAAEDDRARFKIEAEAVARLQHPNIVQVFEVGEVGGLPYFSLEFCTGGSLDRKLDGAPLPAMEAARLVETLARAIDTAHRAHVVHRDLKPANVLLTAEGEPKVTDFGLAKRLDTQGQTRSGAVMGTPSYMAPEQADGQKDVGPAADTYALGAILYELLTGRPPFRAATPLDTILQVVSEEPVPPRRLQSKVPRDVETICLKCLQKQPERRYASAAALAEDLRRFRAGEPIQARPVGRWERTWRWCRRNPMAAGLLLLSLAFGVGSTVAAIQLNRMGNEARHNADLADEAKGQSEQERERMRNLLSRQYVAKGNQLVNEGDLLGSLPWFTEALLLDREDAERARLHRVRLGTVLRQSPRLGRLWCHDEAVTHTELSPDGRLLVVATKGRVQVYDVATGKAHGPPLEQAGPYSHAAFSPDGRRIVTVTAQDGPQRFLNPKSTAQVWDAASGRAVTPPLRHDSHIYEARISRDGRRLITVGLNKQFEARVWDMDGGRLLVSRQFGSNGEILVSYSEMLGSLGGQVRRTDGERLLVSKRNGTVELFEIATGREVYSIHLENLGISIFSPDGLWFVTFSSAKFGSSTTKAQVWDARTGKPTTSILLDTKSQIFDVTFSPDGRLLVMYNSHAANIWDVRTGRQVSVPLSHDMQVTAATFSPDGRYLATASLDRTARVWDTETGQPLTGPLRHGGAVRQAFFADDSGRLITASEDGTVRLWHLSARRSARPMLPHEKALTELSFSADGRHILTASGDTVQLWDAKTGRPAGAPMRHELKVQQVVLSPDGQRAVILCDDPNSREIHNEGYLWDLVRQRRTNLRLKSQITNPPRPSFSRDGRRLFLCDDVRSVKILDATSGEMLERIEYPNNQFLYPLAFSPQGDRIAAMTMEMGGLAGSLFIWDLRAQKPLEISKGSSFRPIFSPDGHSVLTMPTNSIPQILDAESGQPLGPPLDHRGVVTHASFSPDGRRVVTASQDRLAYVWDAATGKRLAALGHPNAVLGSWFNADGRRIITVAGEFPEYEARVWDADTGEALTPPLRHGGFQIEFFSHDYRMAAFSPDDGVLATAYHDHSVGFWDLSPDERPAEDLLLLAQLLTQQKNRAGQNPESLTIAEVRAAWEQLRAKYPESFAASAEDDFEWHRHGAETCERLGLSAEAIRHLDCLPKAQLSDNARHVRLANLGNRGAQVAFDQKDFAKARRLVEEAAGHVRAALTASPKNADYRGVLAENRKSAAKLLIALGDHEAVPKCVADYLEMGGSSSYDAACFLSLCVPLAEKDAKLPEAKRKELAQQYAERAVALLRQAIDKGYSNAEWIKNDKDFDPIRERADFKQCVADLHKKLAPKK